jgi:hypothetical protein
MMAVRTNMFLSTVDRLSTRLGPINRLVGFVADRVTPQATARADSCPPTGYVVCAVYCQQDIFCCGGIIPRQAKMVDYAPKIEECMCLSCVRTCFSGCSEACGSCG